MDHSQLSASPNVKNSLTTREGFHGSARHAREDPLPVVDTHHHLSRYGPYYPWLMDEPM
ncbi:MAG: hypothetical protein IPK42_16515 [Betaproteobacteria bacterium]|nr:hypothetical protein [Betaproteobacteria bacterium]